MDETNIPTKRFYFVNVNKEIKSKTILQKIFFKNIDSHSNELILTASEFEQK